MPKMPPEANSLPRYNKCGVYCDLTDLDYSIKK